MEQFFENIQFNICDDDLASFCFLHLVLEHCSKYWASGCQYVLVSTNILAVFERKADVTKSLVYEQSGKLFESFLFSNRN